MHKVRTAWPLATRVQYLVAYQECRKRWGVSARRFCQEAEAPYATFARWWAAWLKGGKKSLYSRSRRPRHSPSALSGDVLDVIRRTHWELGWGVRRLYAYLKGAGRITCSLSSVYRALRRCGALVRRPHKPKPIWIRYAKAVPGERAQMDLKYLPQGRYQLTLVDDCSRYLAATVLKQRTSAAVCQALPRLLQAFPFPLRCIQTDNGPEFGHALTLLLRGLAIRHTPSGQEALTSTARWNGYNAPFRKSSGMGLARGLWSSGSAPSRTTSAPTTAAAYIAPWPMPHPCGILSNACPPGPNFSHLLKHYKAGQRMRA